MFLPSRLHHTLTQRSRSTLRLLPALHARYICAFNPNPQRNCNWIRNGSYKRFTTSSLAHARSTNKVNKVNKANKANEGRDGNRDRDRDEVKDDEETKRIGALSSRVFGDPRTALLVGSLSANAVKAGGGFPELGGLSEVIITGRANSGKSTLFNAVLGRKELISTSKKAGHTRRLDFFRIGPDRHPQKLNQLVLVDAPGYGKRGRREWGELFDGYVRQRKELRRIYITFNVKHGLNDADREMLGHLSEVVFERVEEQWATASPSAVRSTFKPKPDLQLRLVQLQPILTKSDLLPADLPTARDMVSRMKLEIQDIVVRALGSGSDASSGSGSGSEGRMESIGETRAKLVCLPALVTSSKLRVGVEDVRRSVVRGCCGG